MDIITLTQINSMYVFGVVSLIVAIAAWKWYQIYTTNRADRLDVLQFKKIAGNITSSEREYLASNDWRRVARRRQSKFSWRELVKDFDIQESLGKLNPLKTIRRLEKQIKELRSDNNKIAQNVRTMKWSLGNRIERVEITLEEPEKEEPKKKDKVESQIGNVSFDCSRFV